MRQILRPLIAGLAVLALAGCIGDRSAPTGAARPAAVPPPDMAGRWMLSAATGGECAMNFGAPSQGGDGTIRPEGGCPGNFYTSRRWTFEDGAIIIRDHTSAPLAQLRFAGPGRFEGQSTGGQLVRLVR